MILTAAGLSLLACKPLPQARGVSLPSEAYVWQRTWSPDVRESVVKSQAWLQAHHVLDAEVRFEKGLARVTTFRPELSVLTQGKTGLVIRIFPSAAQTGWNEAAVSQMVGLVKTRLDIWKGNPPAEVQLDYDCPDSKLPDYLRLLNAVKEAVAPLPVTCTALPSWLRQKEFTTLAAAVPGYVLQVHSLHLPKARNRIVALVDLAETKEAVARAVKIGIPFRVALPTYSCVVEFGAEGEVTEVYAEDVPRGLALQSANYVVLDADAYGMADLVSGWRATASPLLQSVVWYRLPVTGDRLNWRLEVLEKVVRGEALLRGWDGHAERKENGPVEIVIQQAGDAPDDLPRTVVVRWPGEVEARAADGLRGYAVAESRPGYLLLRLAEPGRMPRAAPGAKAVVGWLAVEIPLDELKITTSTVP